MRKTLAPVFGLVAAVGVALAAAGDISIEQRVDRAIKPAARLDVRAQGLREAFSEVAVTNPAGAVVVVLTPDEVGDGLIAVTNRVGGEVASAIRAAILVSEEDAGQVAVFNPSGQPRFILDGNRGLLATSGDVAEVFPASEARVPAGTVVVIDPTRPGGVRPSTQPYDRRVVGVASGAGELGPGITLRHSVAGEGAIAVTLTGTVACRVTAANGPIRSGDLLTTSSVPGHAMRATDSEVSRGAILGKAMEDLRSDRGMILVLASLQ